MSLEVSTSKLDGNTAVTTLRGPLTLGTNLQLADISLQRLVSDGISRIVLDLTGARTATAQGWA